MKRILEIEAASFPEEPYSREMFVELYEECGDLFFVAKRAGRIAGYMVTCAGKTSAELVSIAVAPGHRRSGVAARLLARTIRTLRKRGIERLRLMVRTTGSPAIALYRRFGFVRTGRVARYYEDGGDAYRMSLPL